MILTSDSPSTPEAGEATPGPTEWGESRVGKAPWEEEHPGTPRPSDEHFDPELLDNGDRRNVVDAYRYWTREAIVKDIDTRRHTVHVAIDNTPGSIPLETAELPERCLLLFGQEGPGVTEAAREGALMTCSIAQFGSTRSINAGVAAGIAMHTWIRQHADLTNAW